jgi:NAD(P)-dependent dehydrogenase (short-subunit alcohol dehydrogenase family)
MTEQKIALITGGSRGLGKSGALHLAKQNVAVVITYHQNAEAAHAVVQEIQSEGGQAAALKLDVSDIASFDAFVSTLQSTLHTQWRTAHFDYLVNNGGYGIHTALEKTTEAQFDEMMNVHLKGPFFLTQKLLPLINDGGRILNVSSGLTRFSFPGYGAYATMKGAVEVWTRYLAKELGDRKIGVNTLAPGAIATDFGGGAVRDNKDLNQMLAQQTALGRVGEAEDIGRAMASLLHSDLYWVNGQRIEAAGGTML